MEHVDEALVRRARDGDREARRRLAERLGRVLAGRARNFLRNNPRSWAVEDMVDDAWAGLLAGGYGRLLKWRHDGGRTLESFAAMVAKGLWINAMVEEDRKKRGGGVEHVRPDFDLMRSGQRSPEGRVMDKEYLDRLWRFLFERLPTRGIVVLRLIFTDELKPDEAAAALGVNVQVIYGWVFKIRKLAGEFMTSQGGLPYAP